jgi:DNA polymerase-3 subunit epsilon
MRQIVLDTETTGLDPAQGHRVIEIGCVELVDRRLTGNNFHQYLRPDREIDPGAVEVHGITNEFLADKPRFEDVVEDLMAYLGGAELVIHNAPFDVGFLDAELARVGGWGGLGDHCGVTDTLSLARAKHPGQRNSLDALCGRYQIDNSQREKHGALLDAEILAEVFLAMTGGQVGLSLEPVATRDSTGDGAVERRHRRPGELLVVSASAAELAAHEARLAALDKSSDGQTLWRRLES